MTAVDVQRNMEEALSKAGLRNKHKPRLLSDNGSCYISAELKQYLGEHQIQSLHGRPNHPQTQGKIERYHRSMKNVVKLDNYYCPDELKDAIGQFVQYYNHERYHESLQNVTPADVYFGRQEQILKQRELVKRKEINRRRMHYLLNKIQASP